MPVAQQHDDLHAGQRAEGCPAPELAMAEAKRRAVETFLRLRQDDGSLPVIYNCAV